MLSREQAFAWRERGFCTADALLDPADAFAARGEAYALAGVAPAEAAGHPAAVVSAHLVAGQPRRVPFGSAGKLEFPCASEALNRLCTDERIIAAAAQLLGTHDLRLTQADTWLKEGRAPSEPRHFSDSFEQRMHMDFPNHDLAHPSPWDSPDTLAVIIYLDDSSECGGETGVVPRSGLFDGAYSWPYTHLPGVGAIPWVNDRLQAEEMLASHFPETAAFREQLYEREQLVPFRVGSVLFYRHDLWHRGRPVLPGKRRLVCNLVFRTSEAARINSWSPGFARCFYNIKAILAGGEDAQEPRIGAAERFFVSLSPLQRSVLGFPAPGDAYWTHLTVEAVAARWEPLGMDMEPYRTGLLHTPRSACVKRRELRTTIDRLERELEQLARL